jgi:putative two-component system response regulator
MLESSIFAQENETATRTARVGLDEPGVVLVVDDDPSVRGVLGHVLTSAGYTCETVGDVAAARRLLETTTVPLVVTDVQLDGESGIDLLAVIGRVSPRTATIVVTGLDDPSVADIAIESGAYGYLVKPFGPSELLIQIRNALRRRRLEIAARDERSRLELAVEERTAELRRALEGLQYARSQLRLAQDETITRLAIAVEARDEGTAAHIERVSSYTRTLALALGAGEVSAQLVAEASVLHDVGKIGLPDGILLKPGPLTQDERREIERHPDEGWRILSGSGLTILDTAATIARSHHERWDGRGYPCALRAEEIPLEGRIVAVADVFDAVTSDRPYRPALSIAEALGIVEAGAGSHFDPEVVDAFVSSLDDILDVLPGREHDRARDHPQGDRGQDRPVGEEHLVWFLARSAPAHEVDVPEQPEADERHARRQRGGVVCRQRVGRVDGDGDGGDGELGVIEELDGVPAQHLTSRTG